MFITKKHIPRRTFLKGAGVTLACRCSKRWCRPARCWRRRRRRRRAASSGIFFPHGMAPGHWVPKRRGRAAGEAAVHPRVARERQGPDGRPERPLVEVGGAAGGHDRLGPLGRRRVSDRHQAAQDRRFRRHGRQPDDRPAHRAEDRPGDAAAVAAAGRRGSELELEQLRRRLQLLVHELDLVGRPADAARRAMPRTSPLPMELNPQVVFERLFGSGATPEQRAARMKQSRSILDSVLDELDGLRKARSAPATARTVNQYTDEIREIERRIQLAAKASSDVPELRPAAGHSGAVRRAHQAAVRPGRRWPSRPTSRAWRRCSAPAT